MRTLTDFVSFDGLYKELEFAVDAFGVEERPRGKECTELRPMLFGLVDPRKGLYTGESRRLNYRFYAVETLQYLAGWGDKVEHADLLLMANRHLEFALNPETKMFDGAYGPRLSKSLGDIVRLLRRDPSSRQAVASIWEPGIPRDSNDIPCTLSLHFFRTGGRRPSKSALGLMVTMRSNDLNWGTPYDVAAFCAIQCAVADCLNWETGPYTHLDGSLHVYAETPPVIAEPSDENFHVTRNGYVIHHLPRHYVIDWGCYVAQANCFLTELYHHVITERQPFYTFYSILEQENPLDAYWKYWGGMVRWSWKEREEHEDG